MIAKFVFAASLLLSGISMPLVSQSAPITTTATSVQISLATQMNADTEAILIEQFAAPHWNLSIQDAWNAYYLGEMEIIEIEKEKHYRIIYDGGELEVVFEGH